MSSALRDFSATLAFSKSVALSPALEDVQLSTWCNTSVLHHSTTRSNLYLEFLYLTIK